MAEAAKWLDMFGEKSYLPKRVMIPAFRSGSLFSLPYGGKADKGLTDAAAAEPAEVKTIDLKLRTAKK